jgi:hypothetical protein
LCGLLDSILGFLYLRETLIDQKQVLVIYLIPGILLTPILYSYLNKLSDKKGHLVLHYIVHTVVVGGLLLYLLMATNYYFAEENEVDSLFT